MPPRRRREASTDAPPSSLFQDSHMPELSLDTYEQYTPSASKPSSISRKRPPDQKEDFLRALEHDLGELLRDFVALKTRSFYEFRKIWKERDFSLVYAFGFSFLPTEQILFFLPCVERLNDSASDYLACGIIFTAYSLHYSQPCSDQQVPHPIPILEERLRMLKKLLLDTFSNKEEFRDVRFALKCLVREGAYQLTLWPSTTNARKDPSSFSYQEFGSGDLVEVPTRNLRDQVNKIDSAMQMDPILVGDLNDLWRISQDYHNLIASIGLVLPDLPNSISTVNFVQEIENVRRDYAVAIAAIGSKGPTISSRVKRSMLPKQVSRSSASKRRSASYSEAFASPPARPATAPPFERSRMLSTTASDLYRSDSPTLTLNQVSDMPDFSYFGNFDSLQASEHN